MVGGEPCRRDEATAAVRTGLVVISPPLADNLAGLPQRSEPVLVEALVAAGKPRAVVGSHYPRISPEAGGQIGRATCKARRCQYVSFTAFAVAAKKKTKKNTRHQN